MKEQNFQEEHLHQNPNPNPNQDPNQSQGLGLNQIERFINTQVVSRGLDERTAKAYRLDLEQFYLWLGAQGEDGNRQFDQVLTAVGTADKQPFLIVNLGKTAGGEKQAGLGRQTESGEQIGLGEQTELGKRTRLGKQAELGKQIGLGEQAELGKKIGLGEQAELGKPIGLGEQAELRKQADPENGRFAEWMETYLKYLAEEKKLRFSTVSRKQRVFRYYLSYLASQGIVKEYRPLKQVKRPKEGLGSEYLTKKEIDLFFQAIQQEYKELDSDFRRRVCLRDQVMMELLFYHRIEISELLRLEVSDYNPRTAVLTVPRKREKGRMVYLFSKALQGQMARWLEEHEYFEHDGAYRSRMFLSKLGKPLSMKMVVNIFDKYRVRAGIEKMCTPKDLKNSLGRYAEEVVREMG